MTATIQPYLFFGGHCQEAIDFYGKALGARVAFLMHFKDSPEKPPSGAFPPEMENKVMHATLIIGGAEVMVSDGDGTKSGFDGFRLSLALPTEADAQRAFAALADGGSVQMPIAKTFWSPCFGMLTDRFGVGWMVTVPMAPA